MKRVVLKLITFLVLIECFIVFLTSCNNDLKKDVSDVNSISNIFEIEPSLAAKLYPIGYDFEMACQKGLTDSSIYEKKYLLLQSCYRTVFNYYLDEKVGISKYQDSIDKSEYTFPVCKHSEFAKFSSFGRKNIFIRNTLFVERLSTDEIDSFFAAIEDDKLLISDKLIHIVESTWLDIIFVRLEDTYDNKSYEIIYDENGINKIKAYNDALVFEIAYDTEFDSDGRIISKENEKNKYDYILSFANKMESEISELLGCHVSVIIKR